MPTSMFCERTRTLYGENRIYETRVPQITLYKTIRAITGDGTGPVNSHPDLEILEVFEGNALIRLIDVGKEVIVEKGSMATILPNVRHQVTVLHGGKANLMKIRR